MTRNVGNLDALVRIVAGVILLAYGLVPILPDLAAYLPGASALDGWVWLGLSGIVPVATGIAGTCPAYRVVGISTCAAP